GPRGRELDRSRSSSGRLSAPGGANRAQRAPPRGATSRAPNRFAESTLPGVREQERWPGMHLRPRGHHRAHAGTSPRPSVRDDRRAARTRPRRASPGSAPIAPRPTPRPRRPARDGGMFARGRTRAWGISYWLVSIKMTPATADILPFSAWLTIVKIPKTGGGVSGVSGGSWRWAGKNGKSKPRGKPWGKRKGTRGRGEVK